MIRGAIILSILLALILVMPHGLLSENREYILKYIGLTLNLKGKKLLQEQPENM
jgi:hypothetical protein